MCSLAAKKKNSCYYFSPTGLLSNKFQNHSWHKSAQHIWTRTEKIPCS